MKAAEQIEKILSACGCSPTVENTGKTTKIKINAPVPGKGAKNCS